MKEDAVDRLLVVLALLAPLALVALGKWQASLESWYVPQEKTDPAYLDDAFVGDVTAWLQAERKHGTVLYVVVDDECPCTMATLDILRSALDRSGRADIRLELKKLDESAVTNSAWRRVVARIPSTPTLLASEGDRVLYAGPVTAGNICSVGAQRVLGLSVLQAKPEDAVINSLERGCYCAVKSTDT